MTDLNALFDHPRIDILGSIDTAIENGIIYNVDYKSLKDAANRKLQEGYRAAVTEPYLEGLHTRNEEISPEMSDILYYSGYPQAHTLNARDKGITKLEKTDPDHWMVKAAREYLELVRPVIEKLVIIKGLVVKGRKPSTTPRQTPERTIENTGTCSVCGRNVKLKFGNIVDHGYTVTWGYQEGNCAGVGYEPIEISIRGTVAYLASLNRYKADQEAALPKAIKVSEALAGTQKAFEDNREQRAVRHAPHNIESQIRYVEKDIEMYTKIIAEWEVKPLPDAA